MGAARRLALAAALAVLATLAPAFASAAGSIPKSSAAPSAVEPTPRAAKLRRTIRIGISDQKADMFADKRFGELGVRHARLAISWDALRVPWQVAELDAWLAAARSAGVTPLLSIGHSRTNRRSLPRPARLRREFRRLRERYPWVTTYATWNEANHCGEPTCHRPQLVAAYYRQLRRECRRCTILAPELLDLPNAVKWVRAFRKQLGFTPKRWGLHNYIEANRFKTARLRKILRALPGAELWLTETGGLVRRDNASTTRIPEGSIHAGEVTRFLFDRVLPRNPRIKAVYLYHWNAGSRDTTWDSGLINVNGQARSSFRVLERVLTSGTRPTMSYRSASRKR